MAEDRRGAMDKLRQMIKEDEENGWDLAWQSDVTPWDAGHVQPPLKEVLGNQSLRLPTSGTALVPGCGRGYDAIYIAKSLGLKTLGTDISPTAIAAAQTHLASLKEDVDVRFEVADFFAIHGVQFDLIYDYTFFVAIPPARRADWGRHMAELVKPGGFLITLVFPLDPDTGTGPPFYVLPEHYDKVLGDGWEVIVDKVPDVSSETHNGRERIVVRRKL